jgi:hypothetical protein
MTKSQVKRQAEKALARVQTGLTFGMTDALLKHGPPTYDPVRMSATLGEELGEVIQHALDITRGIDSDQPITQQLWTRRKLSYLIYELNQLASYAILQLHNLDVHREEIIRCVQQIRESNRSPLFREHSGGPKPKGRSARSSPKKKNSTSRSAPGQ